MTTPRIILGISGASGAIYGVRLLELLNAAGIETHLIISRTGQLTLAHETQYSPRELQALAHTSYSPADLSAACASGSFTNMGMIVAPCSMRSLGEIATGTTSGLLTRSADVTLKERRRLVLLTRESPLTLAHIRNMETVTEMGGIIAPPVPAFYTNPTSINDIVDHTVGRILDLFGIESGLVKRWSAMKEPAAID